MTAAQKKKKKRVVIKTKSGSYVPDFMRVSPDDETGSKSMSKSADTVKKDTKPKEEEKDKVKSKVEKEPEVEMSDTAKRRGKEKKYKPKKAEELVDKSKEDYEVPLEISNKKIYFIFLFLLIVVFVSTSVSFFLKARQPLEKTEEVAVEVEVEEGGEEAVLPTPSFLKRAEIKLEILNGSGKAGLAGETRDVFEELGYEVVSIGNADEVVGSQLYVRSDYQDQIDMLLTDVNEKLQISSVSGDLDESGVDARIVLGE
jgi:hypothetical protein